MCHVITEFVMCLFVCSCAVQADELPTIDGLTKNMTDYIKIARPGMEEDIVVTLRRRDRFCEAFMMSEHVSGLTEDDSLQPIISLNTDKEALDIRWKASVCKDTHCKKKAKRYPRKFIIHLALYEYFPDRNTSVRHHLYDSSCIRMKLDNRRVLEETNTEFYLNGFIPLVGRPNILLSVQILSLPDGKIFSQCLLPNRSKSFRQKRALSQCQQSVQCSKETFYPLSKNNDVNTYMRCVTYDEAPKVTPDHFTSGRLKITVTGIRPFHDDVTITLWNHIGNTTDEEKTFKYDDIQDGIIVFETTKTIKPGSYLLLISVDCLKGDNIPSNLRNLHHDDHKVYESKITVAAGLPQGEVNFWTQMNGLPAVAVALLLATCVVVIVLVILYTSRRKQHCDSTSGNISDINNVGIQLQEISQVTTHIQESKHIEESKELSPLLNGKPEAGDEMEGSKGQTGKHEICDYRSDMTVIKKDAETPGDVSDDADKGESGTLNHRKKNILMLYQPNSEDPQINEAVKRLPDLIQIINNLQVTGELSMNDRFNWTLFANTALDKFDVFLVMLSEDLHDLFRLDQKSGTEMDEHEKARLEALLSEREYERIPCVVLDGIPSQMVMRNLKVILIASCRSLVNRFLDEHKYLNSKNCRSHVFIKHDVFTSEMTALSTDFTNLLTEIAPQR